VAENSSIWYVAANGAQEGPFSFAEIVAAVAQGKLKEHDLIWRPGLPSWSTAASVPGLFIPPEIAHETSVAKAETMAAAAPPVVIDAHTDRNSVAEAAIGPGLSTDSKVVQRPKKGNYFSRHWRGDLSLAVSYWINGFLLNILVGGATVAYVAYAESVADEGLIKAFILMNVFIAFLLIAYTWQFVGVWRAASNSPKRGGSRLWAVLAQVLIVLGVLRFAGEFATEVAPVYGRFTEILFVEEPAKKLSVAPLHSGAVINFDGEIKIGSHKAFRATLDAAPNAKVVRLKSNGGWISEAKAIAIDIRERRLEAVVDEYCVSACTYLFLSGSKRWLTDEGRLGFHAPGNSVTKQTTSEDIEKERRSLVGFGVPQAMADKAVSTPHSSMWYPTEFELQGARLIDGVIDSAGFERTGSIRVVTVADRVREGFAKVPLFDAIRIAEPATFEKIVTQAAADVARGLSSEAAGAKFRPLIQSIIKKYLPSASDDLLLKLATINQQYLERWRRDDVLSCVAFSDPSKAPGKTINPGRYSDLSSQELALHAAIIRSGSQAAFQIPSDSEIHPELIDVLSKIEYALPGKVALLDKEKLSPAEFDAFCAVNIELYKQIALRGRPSQIRLLRYIFGNL
jgi:hypothetical protein